MANNIFMFPYRLQRFEKTNEMLLNCNALSTSRLKIASEEFKKHTKLLGEMKKDLDYIFKKLRVIKSKVTTQYPDAFAEVNFSNKTFAEEAEEDEEIVNKTKEDKAQDSQSSVAPVKVVKPQKSATEKKISKEVGYVKMEHSPDPDAGRSSADIDKRQSLGSNKSTSTDNSNDSSDCTSDTG